MKAFEAELALAKTVTREALSHLGKIKKGSFDYNALENFPREMKATADLILERVILAKLLPTDMSILTEEAGAINESGKGDLRWVVDPLDGTVNFVRGLASCAVSIALCQGNDPIFGVIGEYPSSQISWGGALLGAFTEDQPLRVSTMSDKGKAVLCTGLPSRFDYSEHVLTQFVNRLRVFGKIRMLGAASLSLLQVAKGAADAYSEQDIMIWDVAAGLAIVQGAGGVIDVKPGRFTHAHKIFASNGLLMD
jgi:myo-inositol-1(or 4)-monophosphatase